MHVSFYYSSCIESRKLFIKCVAEIMYVVGGGGGADLDRSVHERGLPSPLASRTYFRESAYVFTSKGVRKPSVPIHTCNMQVCNVYRSVCRRGGNSSGLEILVKLTRTHREGHDWGQGFIRSE